MCDALIAARRATLNGGVIFAKNSDRPPNESQPIVYRPRLTHRETTVKCQNIKIPQVKLTFEHIGSGGYWVWGYEHGLNEFGVAIGDLDVQSREPCESKAGLISMDLVRLGVERSRTAHEAVKVITSLVEEYGTNGNYILADPNEAWVLETAGRYWVAKRIVDGVYPIGNLYSIQTVWDECHPNLIDHAIEMGWCTSKDDFNFARAYGDYTNHPIDSSMVRYRRSKQLLEQYEGHITPEIMMEILRDHLEGTFLESFWAPGENFYASICCHERGEGEWRGGQTASSMVVELRRDIPDLLKAQCWICMAAPCTSVFMPFYHKQVKVPENLSIADKEYSASSPWWVFKKLQRHTERNYPLLGYAVRKVWKDMERRVISQRSMIENEALDLIREGKEAEAISILQDFVNTCPENSIRQARQLDKLLYDLERNAPKYTDLREEYLNSLNKKVKLEI